MTRHWLDDENIRTHLLANTPMADTPLIERRPRITPKCLMERVRLGMVKAVSRDRADTVTATGNGVHHGRTGENFAPPMPPNHSNPRASSSINPRLRSARLFRVQTRAARTRDKPATRTRRVVIVDEHPMVAEWIGCMFGGETDLKVCGRAHSFEAAVETIAKHDPDIVITELALQDRRGAEVVRLIKSRFGRVPLLVLSALPEAMCAEAAILAGAHGYISKREPGATLMLAIRKVLAGGVFVSPKVTDALLLALKGGRQPGRRSPLVVLSPRELQLFRLVGQGYKPKEIALKLKLSVRTVESYALRIREKLGLASAHELFRAAVAWVTASGG